MLFVSFVIYTSCFVVNVLCRYLYRCFVVGVSYMSLYVVGGFENDTPKPNNPHPNEEINDTTQQTKTKNNFLKVLFLRFYGVLRSLRRYMSLLLYVCKHIVTQPPITPLTPFLNFVGGWGVDVLQQNSQRHKK